ncbi:Neuronal PAS domain-containing protein 4-like [Triplophysa tibetana]|uniref:Neuronal PAS domain-containing protein 4-like n=1 Tax=Triplophysa tibetana TaxID=1572043 RepID=A0A5A9PC15_9TELE|nr:Neuronal PAS domain-containing protein 4-like [Triplophysa tibetana]
MLPICADEHERLSYLHSMSIICTFMRKSALLSVNRLRDVDYLSDYMCFQTLHKPDMSFTDAPHSVFFHLGFSSEKLIGRSWYGLLHPDDLTVSAGLHKTLVEDDGEAEVQMVVRLQREDLAWVWIYMRASMEGTRPVISCKNHVISETEAIYLKEKLYSSASMSSSRGGGRCLKRQSECETLTDEPRTKTRRTSDHHTHEEHTSSFFCTPPYSPTSSLSSDFLSEAVDVLVGCDGLDQFSSQAFPLGALSLGSQLFSDPPRDLHTHVPDAHLVPVDQPVPDACQGGAERVLHPEDLRSCLLPHSAVLTPESSPVAERHFQYSEMERDEISVLARQIYSLASSFDAYSTHISRVNTASCWMHAPEPLLDERVMEGILRDLDVVKENHVHSLHVRTPLTVNTHNGCDINSELNQLNHCLYGDIREGE